MNNKHDPILESIEELEMPAPPAPKPQEEKKTHFEESKSKRQSPKFADKELAR